jgi:hypothetical protein
MITADVVYNASSFRKKTVLMRIMERHQTKRRRPVPKRERANQEMKVYLDTVSVM